MFLTIVNFKTYPQATAEHARSLALACAQAAEEGGFNIMLAPQSLDMKDVADHTDLLLLGQHCDSSKPGQSTGHITPESLRAAGASGSIINHSEYKFPGGASAISECIERLKENGMLAIVCVSNLEEGKEIEQLHPDYIAYEPPEFIGSETSVVDGDEGSIKEFIENIETPVIIGAGIKSKHDIKVCQTLRAQGMLIASHVVKSDSPVSYLKELLAESYGMTVEVVEEEEPETGRGE